MGIDADPMVPPGHPLYGRPVCIPTDRCSDRAKIMNDNAYAVALAGAANPNLNEGGWGYFPSYNKYGCYNSLSIDEQPHITQTIPQQGTSP